MTALKESWWGVGSILQPLSTALSVSLLLLFGWAVGLQVAVDPVPALFAAAKVYWHWWTLYCTPSP